MIGLVLLFADIKNIIGAIRVFRDWGSYSITTFLTGSHKGRVVIDDNSSDYIFTKGVEEYVYYGT